jgi:uncharacterized membrane protein YccC
MLLRILAAFHLDDPSSLKRALATMIGGLVVLLIDPILAAKGMPAVSDTALELFAGLIAGFVLQSGAKSAIVAKAEISGPTVAAPPAPGVPL